MQKIVDVVKREYPSDDIAAMTFSGVDVGIDVFERGDWATVLDLNENAGGACPAATYVALAMTLKPHRMHEAGDTLAHADIVMKALQELGVASRTGRDEVAALLLAEGDTVDELASDQFESRRRGFIQRVISDGILA